MRIFAVVVLLFIFLFALSFFIEAVAVLVRTEPPMIKNTNVEAPRFWVAFANLVLAFFIFLVFLAVFYFFFVR